MEPDSTAIPPFDALIEAEHRNFQVITKGLGPTTELVQDFEDLYQTLADSIRISAADGFNHEQAKVGGHVLLLLMKARGDLLVGCLNLLRGYQGNSIRFLRGAIEACAFAAGSRSIPIWPMCGSRTGRAMRTTTVFERSSQPASSFQPMTLCFRNSTRLSTTVRR